jgi:biopolymer transport protein ExbD
MRPRRMPEIREGSVNVTPLIDIVMCLIIFFMLVAKIGVDTGSDRNIDIPSSFIGMDLKDMGNTLVLNVVNPPTGIPDPQPIITALGKDGQMGNLKLHDQLGSKVVYPLRDELTRLREGDPAHGISANADFKVIIRGDKSLTYQFLAPILVECNLAHVNTYAFNTKTSDTQ